MKYFWLGLSLVSASWLFGLDYFFKAELGVWITLVALGTILICVSQSRLDASPAETPTQNRLWSAVLALVFVPAAIVMPWPYRIAPVLMIAGALLEMFPLPRRWPRVAATGMTLSSIVLFAQALTLAVYKYATARSHELPWPLPQSLAGFVQLLGVNATVDGSDLVLSTMRENHHLGATWDFFFDPVTICFVMGGIVALVCSSGFSLSEEPSKSRTGSQQTKARTTNVIGSARLKAIGLLLLATALWLPLRAVLHAGCFLHRALRTEYDAPLNLLNQFWSPWPQLLLLLPLALLVAWWMRHVSVPSFLFHYPDVLTRRTIVLGFATAAVLTLAVLWDPIGERKAGRIAIDEFHSKWEPTDRPMDTEWYGHLSGYNYACLYDFCSRYYEMSRLTNSLTDAALANVDVLILKVPTERFQTAEIDVVIRYLERGGSALLIGEHTDVFNTSFHLNPIARRLGFEFRHDCLFGMESFFDQFYQPPRVRHPVLQNVPGFDFATSCSIETKSVFGRGVIVSTGLKNSMADYHANNYYPQAVDHAGMRAGAFVQLWSARHGRGRVLAFTDSTIFSNFSAFEPGKIELFVGMLEWLNRRDGLRNPRPFLLLLGVALLAWSAFVAYKQLNAGYLMLAAGITGWSLTSLALAVWQRQALPEPKPTRPLTWVTIDRTVCDGPLSKGGFIAGKADGFGIFERWILRLGYFIKRRSGADALQGDLIAFFYPTKPVSREFSDGLLHYVERGGKVLVLDSPTNKLSTAAALLEPFGLSQKPLPTQGGGIIGPAGWPAVPIDGAHEISGGRPLFHLAGKPIGAVVHHGKGTIVAVGFGSRFSDAQMGVTGDVVPDENLRKVFDLQFALVRAIIQDKLGASNSEAK
jgi:hypothetical protein